MRLNSLYLWQNLLKAACTVMAIVSLPVTVLAEEPPRMVHAIKLYEGTLKYPPPLWMKTKDTFGDFKVSRKQENNSFHFELIPKAQDFENWTRIYGIYAWQLADYTLQRFMDESLNALALGCKNQAKSTLIAAEDGRIVMTYMCPCLDDMLVSNGNDAESGFLYISKINNTFVKAYQAWRYSSKDIGTDRSPMSRDTITEAAEDMKSIRFITE
jgi:hypothetical protein